MKIILIGIPTFNGAYRINHLLTSLKKVHDIPVGYKIELLLVDDGSPDSDQMNWIARHFGVPVIFHAENKGISASWNDICMYGNPDYICLLNDDIMIVDNWLTSGIYMIEHNPIIGIVGWDFNRIIEDDIEGILNGKAAPFRHKNSAKIMDAIIIPDKPMLSFYAPGCSFMMSRDTYEMTDGFDENYKSFFEEVSFSVQLHNQGVRSITLNHPRLFHLWARTFETNVEALKPSQRMLESRMYFKQKWDGDIPEVKARLMEGIEPMEVKWLDENLEEQSGILGWDNK
ncbi:hypothetical protein LCGC14_0512240 [marine sediment metagenome]|uniref:Glycosyltransferase 2-like domain-containing protein n=1 Tax=marine sediment metagenome TaxID=412755 RepID=A0A0F9SJF6_9ZZZZ